MSNGSQCCALEICCPPSDIVHQQLNAKIATETGIEAKTVQTFLTWMDSNNLVFAPSSFKPVVSDLVAMVRKHDAAPST